MKKLIILITILILTSCSRKIGCPASMSADINRHRVSYVNTNKCFSGGLYHKWLWIIPVKIH